ncbi:MAG: rod shape-determining protein MreD [Anaerolineae bacterium]
MTAYLLIPLLAIVALIQATVMPHLRVWGVFPDLPLLVVASWALLRGAREGLIWGFIAGLAVDLSSGAPLGAATISLMVAGGVSGFGEATVFRSHVALPLVTVAGVTVLYDLLFLLVMQLSGQEVVWLESLWRTIVPSALLNMLISPLVLGMMHPLHRWFGREKMEW